MQEKLQNMKESNMKNLSKPSDLEDEMRSEYDFSDSGANKYAAILKKQDRLIPIDADVFKVFDNSEKVNSALRYLIKAMPKRKSKHTQKI